MNRVSFCKFNLVAYKFLFLISTGFYGSLFSRAVSPNKDGNRIESFVVFFNKKHYDRYCRQFIGRI